MPDTTVLPQAVPLRQSLPSAPSSPASSQARELPLRFTGSGSEYFRIWIVNLLLTIVTLGIYSAWAKVRRIQYFDRNTELDGAVFDFTGSPKAILVGRLMAGALLGVYQYAIGFSLEVGLALAVGLLAGMPLLLRGALRFRLAHTRYRGLRFGFTGSIGGAYCAYLPLSLLLLPVLLATAVPQAAVIILLGYALWPLMHCLMKRYQHGNVGFASLRSRIDMGRMAFYKPYLIMVGTFMLAILVGIIVAVIVMLTGAMAGLADILKGGSGIGIAAFSGPIVVLLLASYAMTLVGYIYIQVRTANLTWEATSFPGLTIRSSMQTWGYFKLQTVNLLLTLLTLGLYRPFAVVKTHQYRLAHLHLMADDSLEQALTSALPQASSASGDGVADLFAIDLSW